ncbi:hypothetical protein V8D89_004674 [Ganoderma adspersum]
MLTPSAGRRSTFNWEGTVTVLYGALPSLQNVFLATRGFLSNWEGHAMEDVDEGRGC